MDILPTIIRCTKGHGSRKNKDIMAPIVLIYREKKAFRQEALGGNKDQKELTCTQTRLQILI